MESDNGGQFKVEADFGGGWVFLGRAHDRIGYLALADKAYRDGAKAVQLWRSETIVRDGN